MPRDAGHISISCLRPTSPQRTSTASDLSFQAGEQGGEAVPHAWFGWPLPRITDPQLLHGIAVLAVIACPACRDEVRRCGRPAALERNHVIDLRPRDEGRTMASRVGAPGSKVLTPDDGAESDQHLSRNHLQTAVSAGVAVALEDGVAQCGRSVAGSAGRSPDGRGLADDLAAIPTGDLPVLYAPLPDGIARDRLQRLSCLVDLSISSQAHTPMKVLEGFPDPSRRRQRGLAAPGFR